MRFFRALLVTGLVAATVAGCAKPVKHTDQTQVGSTTRQEAMVGEKRVSSARMQQASLPRRLPNGTLAGRTLEIASTADIVLRPREVVLTFDDGPRPGKTPAILDTLDRYGVKATFLMLGSAAETHPRLARLVAQRGHTVGSHTYNHADLSTLDRPDALAEIARGEAAVAQALRGSGESMAPFFRFPYLAQTGFLRTSLLQGDVVVLDVDIDSKDYYRDSAEDVAARTLARLEARGSGIILFHDIHQRTVDMLPGFLADLEARGYSVVRLEPKGAGVFGRSVVTADALGQ